MGDNQNWYRQLLALLLLSTAKAAVEYITNPGSRQDAAKQLREAFQQIDYESAAKALTQAIDDAADASKDRLDTAIDVLRDKGVEAVDEGRKRAEKQVGKKKGGRLRFLIGVTLGALIAYYLMDEQRRDDLLDRLTGASGPIESATQSAATQVTTSAQQAVDNANAQQTSPSAADQAEQVAKEAAQKADESKK